jgi:hypothetical protein
MKKTVTIIIFYLLINVCVSQTLTDVARNKELTWYGVDFTQCRFIGFNSEQISSINLNVWGYTTLTEKEENLIKKSFGKKTLSIETSTALDRNSTLDCKTLVSDHTYGIDIEKIQNVVSNYKIMGVGYGVIFIVESVEIVSNSIFIWVVYVNNQTGQIVSSRRYTGCGWSRDHRRGEYYGDKGIKLVLELCGQDLKQYK